MLSLLSRATNACAAICVFVFAVQPAAVSAQEFDLHSGNAPVEVIIPRVIPAVLASVSPTGSDATIVLRITTIITNSWFDAIAPYHPTAVGVYSRLPREPEEERTDYNRNVAILYASYHTLNSLLPQHRDTWRDMLLDVGLDPDARHARGISAIRIGRVAGIAVVAARQRDGMNQLGDEGGVIYNRRPYADYTGYRPVNTAHDLIDPSRWQPDIVTTGSGIFKVQQFVTPQLALTRPYTYDTPERFRAPAPDASDYHGNYAAYRQQADEVLSAAAFLTDHQKSAAEFFDNKFRSLGFSALFLMQAHRLTLEEFVHVDFLLNVASFDTGIAVWNEKARYDAVRPFSAIRHLYGDQPVTAWGGLGQGTVTDLPATQWRSYLNTADHPEYPSGSASFCAAHAQAARRYFGSDDFGWTVEIPKESSWVEPGVTPAEDVTLGWTTWSDFEQECAMSRVWGGVHFRSSLAAGQDIGRPIGDLAYEFVSAQVRGMRLRSTRGNLRTYEPVED